MSLSEKEKQKQKKQLDEQCDKTIESLDKLESTFKRLLKAIKDM